MDLTLHIDPGPRTARLEEIAFLASGDSFDVTVVVRGRNPVPPVDVTVRRDGPRGPAVASCTCAAAVPKHPSSASGGRMEIGRWDPPEPAASDAARKASGPFETGWIDVSDGTGLLASCPVPLLGRGASDV